MKWYLNIFSLFSQKTVRVECKIITETERAFFIELVGVKQWIPKRSCKVVERTVGGLAIVKIDKNTFQNKFD